MELIQKTISIATLVFVLSSMLATGLGLTVSEIITPLRNARLVVLSLLANFVVMPLAAPASWDAFALELWAMLLTRSP